MTTLADVAKRAAVSLSTASYVLSGKRPISDATRTRVLAAMDELGFHPNNQGRALASGRTRTIALLYPAADAVLSPMPMEFVTATASRAEERGYALVLSTTQSTREQVLSLLRRGFVDGFVVMEVSLSDPRVDLLIKEKAPFALIGRRQDNTGQSFVDLDFEHAIEIAVEHLAGLGHRTIAVICRNDGSRNDYGPTARMRQSFNRLKELQGLRGDVFTCAAHPAAGAELLDTILKELPDVTAMITSNTESITGLFRSAHEKQIVVPDDLSIVGLISSRVAEFLRPAITAVDFPVEEMGRKGVDFLIDQLEGGVSEPQQLVLRSSVIIRATTGPASKRIHS